jgi:DNA (cytosine-5)-methyltransferase 1
MRELSLFSGAGGGLLGTKLLGWQHFGYVEFNIYCQQVIAQRIKDGILDEAPIFSDIRAFLSEGYAESYKGMVDVITAGFPCQPFSTAGKQLGADDPRNMWPATISCIRTIRPKYCFLENVPALATSGYFGTVLGDLAEAGYSARWRILSAAELGAPHKRDRLWIVGYTSSKGSQKPVRRISERQRPTQSSKELAYSSSKSSNECQAIGKNGESSTQKPRGSSGKNNVAYSDKERLQRGQKARDTKGKGKKRNQQFARCSELLTGDYWSIEPDVGRVANGVASRVDRLKALGNGQVPAVVATAWQLLINN